MHNKLFNDFFIPFYERYTEHSKAEQKYEISLDSLQALTAYFYYSKKSPRDNSIVFSVCMIRNPFKDYKDITPELLEIGGFCMLAIDNEKMWSEFAKFREQIDKEIIDLKLSDEELIKMKGTKIYSLMKESKIVRKAILETYENNSQILGFKIKN